MFKRYKLEHHRIPGTPIGRWQLEEASYHADGRLASVRNIGTGLGFPPAPDLPGSIQNAALATGTVESDWRICNGGVFARTRRFPVTDEQ